MKSKQRMLLGFCSALWLICVMAWGNMSLAGDINSAEAAIISVLGQTYEYNGTYYKVKDEYISQVRTYLSQDGVDLSESEANAYIAQFYAAVESGSNLEYTYVVGQAPAKDLEEAPNEVVTGESTENTSETSAEVVATVENEETPAVEDNTVFDNTVFDNTVFDNTELEEKETVSQADNATDTETTSLEKEDGAETVGIDETKNKEMEDEDQAEENTKCKDYSGARKLQNGINVELVVACVIIVTALIAVGLVLFHKMKRR